ncbi:SEN34 subunit of tRNA-splicing endonuclease [Hypoxylon sp. FL1857]|nr:SEN34 subunit of tRNA-splicing endonuclease [Hypoxylon sp. FL1857]
MVVSIDDRAPVRIAKVAGRYLLFDIDDVMYLRRHHNICSVFVGTIPQNPQQNIFMGLPVELMPEEAQVLVDKKVAYVVDDAAFHPARLAALDENARRRYLQSIKAEGRKAQQAAAEFKENTKPKVIKRGKTKSKAPEGEIPQESNAPEKGVEGEDEFNSSLFSPPSPQPSSGDPSSPAPNPFKAEEPPFAITPTTSSLLLSPPHSPEADEHATSIEVPPSYPLYAHLQDRGYYMMPGLRFGCDYNVYPGDPLRFHSHFQATSYGWDEEISMLDLVAGGRLGTNVKKGYLVGGAVADANGMLKQEEEEDGKGEGGNPNAPKARAFTIEWAAM